MSQPELSRHAHVSDMEARGLLVLAAVCQLAMGFGLYGSRHFAAFWGTWFVLSSLAAAIAAIRRESRIALSCSGIGVVVGCAGRCLMVLRYFPWGDQPIAVGLARASIYALAAGMAFIVWAGVLAPCNGIVRAEKRLDAKQ